jgi:hypothetical protein
MPIYERIGISTRPQIKVAGRFSMREKVLATYGYMLSEPDSRRTKAFRRQCRGRRERRTEGGIELATDAGVKDQCIPRYSLHIENIGRALVRSTRVAEGADEGGEKCSAAARRNNVGGLRGDHEDGDNRLPQHSVNK